MVITIPLTQGKVATVDDEDYPHLCGFKWHARRDRRKSVPDCWYARRSEPRPGGTRSKIYMHREILGMPDGERVDHVDGDGLNNVRSNLRPCTQGQNCANERPRQGHSSRYRGVTWNAGCRKWQAVIQALGKKHYLGLFQNEDDAAKAYDAAADQHFGSFARLNFPASSGAIA